MVPNLLSVIRFFSTDATKDNPKFLILHGSETGQAEAIAEQIEEKAKECELAPYVQCLSQVNKSFNLEKEWVIVFVVSTTGDGEIPEKARKFWRILRKSAENSLKYLQYTFLALGDTNYTNFCNSGKMIDERLYELGATKFYPTGFADDGTSLETVVEPWIEGLWQPLQAILKPSGNKLHDTEKPNLKCDLLTINGHDVMKDHIDEPAPPLTSSLVKSASLADVNLTVPAVPKSNLTYHWVVDCSRDCDMAWNFIKLPSAASDVFLSNFVTGKYLTKANSLKRTIEVTLDISEGNVQFEPGDSFGIIPRNNEGEVCCLLSRLGMSGNKGDSAKVTSTSTKPVPSHIPDNMPLQELFLSVLEIRAVPKKAFLRVLAEHTSDEAEKRRLLELCSRQGAEEYQRFIRQENLWLMDILAAFPSCKPPLETILQHLPPLLPRFYSVVNSPLSDPNIIKVAFNVIEFSSGNGRHEARRGVCSGYLEDFVQKLETHDLSEQLANFSLSHPKVPVYLRTNNTFKLPEDLSAPVIMIGPGTGIAPFIGFLEHISHKVSNLELGKENANTWLFFGCRNKERDFLYEEEVLDFQKTGVLKNLSLSFSRDPGDPIYVQDNIKMHKHKFVELLHDENIHLYVCGDATGMAKHVYECIITVIKEVENTTEKEADDFVKQLQADKRYLQDIWA